jgi:pentatricopeptide repeat protein
MVAGGLQPDLRSYSIAMNAMCEVGDVDGAREVLEALLASGVSPDMRVYSTLAKGRGVFPRV